MNYSDPTKLPERTIPTSRVDFFYSIPDDASLPGRRKFTTIPKAYLIARLENATAALGERVKIAMAKHLADRKEAVLQNIAELKTKISAILDAIPGDSIINAAQLDEMCTKTKKTVQEFKSDRERNIDVGQKVAEIIFQIEHGVIQTLFHLPDKKEAKKSERKIESLENLELVNAQIKGVNDPFIQVQGTLHELKKCQGGFEKAWNTLRECYAKVNALVARFPHQESFENIPEDVRDACMTWYKKYKEALETNANFIEAYERLTALTERMGDLDRLGNAFPFYDGLMGMNEIPELQTAYRELQGLRAQFDEVVPTFKEAIKFCRDFQDTVSALRSSEDIKQLAEVILSIVPNGNDNKIRMMFPAAPKESEPEIDVESGKVQDMGKKQKFPPFYWKKVSAESAREEARKRLIQCNPLVAYLIETNNLAGVKEFIARVTTEDLHNSGLSNACFGNPEALFKTKENLLNAIFPEFAGDAIAVLKIASVKREGRFRWIGQGITADEIRSEARSRLFQWPLLKELALNQKWIELRQFLDKVGDADLKMCGINASCCGGSQAPYKSPEEMLADLFPHAYSSNRP